MIRRKYKRNYITRYLLSYCVKCNDTLQYDVKYKPLICNKCNTLLKFKCKRCSKMYKTLGSLRSHLSRQCGLIEPKFKCDQCPFKSYGSINLKQHMYTWHSSIPNHKVAKKKNKFLH